MRALFALLLSLTMTGALLAPAVAFSAEQANGSKGKVVQRPKSGSTTVRGDAPIALTVDECKALGGSVGNFKVICKSGTACTRRDEGGVQHTVCISKAK